MSPFVNIVHAFLFFFLPHAFGCVSEKQFPDKLHSRDDRGRCNVIHSLNDITGTSTKGYRKHHIRTNDGRSERDYTHNQTVELLSVICRELFLPRITTTKLSIGALKVEIAWRSRFPSTELFHITCSSGKRKAKE